MNTTDVGGVYFLGLGNCTVRGCQPLNTIDQMGVLQPMNNCQQVYVFTNLAVGQSNYLAHVDLIPRSGYRRLDYRMPVMFQIGGESLLFVAATEPCGAKKQDKYNLKPAE